MTNTGKKNSGLLYEIRRRRLLPAITTYAIIAWALVEAFSLFVETFNGPDILVRIAIVFAVAGLPVTLLLAWIFDISPDAFRPTTDEKADRAPTAKRSKLKQANVAVLTCLPVANTSIFDPEELIELRADLARHFEETVRLFGGQPVTNSGLECQAIFGHPRKYRNYLQRSLDCGLALVSDPLKPDTDNSGTGFISNRIGLHAGSVLVPGRGVKSGDMHAHAILGETGRLATRIAHSAPPGTIMASSAVKTSLPETLAFKRQESVDDNTEANHWFLLEKSPV